jgi:hypothetical protein
MWLTKTVSGRTDGGNASEADAGVPRTVEVCIGAEAVEPDEIHIVERVLGVAGDWPLRLRNVGRSKSG